MAPKGMKRPSYGGVAASKRGRTDTFEGRTKEKCDAVTEEIKSYEALAEPARKMLCSVIENTLPILKEDRHDYQNRAIELVGDTLSAIRLELEAKIADIQNIVDNVDAEKSKIEECESTASAEVEKLKGLLGAARETRDADVKAFGEAEAALAVAKSDQAYGDRSFTELSDKKAELESIFNETFKPAQTYKAAKKRELNRLEKVCKQHEFEPKMLAASLGMLSTEPSARGTYDKLVARYMEESFTKHISSMTAELETMTPARQTRASEVESKTSELEAAKERCNSSKLVFDTASVSMNEGTKALAEAKAAAANFESKTKADAEALVAAKGALEEFISGPLQCFSDCKELAPPPPEPEVAIVEEPAASEALPTGAEPATTAEESAAPVAVEESAPTGS